MRDRVYTVSEPTDNQCFGLRERLNNLLCLYNAIRRGSTRANYAKGSVLRERLRKGVC